ncbi:hypothetical protein LO80_09075 [Candidatus Francisella endociliophora]|uniref:Uncharacterized protein n=1 Tax=Candidatus Francisella endociliophora TaxID=653937 RepID=A0A097ERC5_9GAMM|nr:hypothetical protein [Francisella sp. FSC1006]AIT10109.1 hypothetical protein LO80_09075 [Francisella sp. FSC1006]
MKKIIKKIVGGINIPLIIFLLIVGSVIVVFNMKNEKVQEAKATVNNTVNNVSKTLNNAAENNSNSVE